MSAPDAELIGLIYEAATEPTRWLTLRERLSEELDGNFWIFFTGVSTVADGKPTFLGGNNELRTHLVYRGDDEDPLHVFIRSCEPGWVGTAHDALPPDVMATTEHFRQMSRQADYGGSILCVLVNEQGRLITAGLTVRGRDCTEADLERVRALTPHLLRAVRLSDHLREIEHRHHRMRETIDLLHVAVILVSCELRVQWCNAPARRLIERGDILRRHDDVLTTADAAEAPKLLELVSNARAGKPEVTRVKDPEESGWCSVLATQISGADAAASPAVALFVSHSSEIEIDAAILCALHGLTPAEAEVTRLLATGQSTEEIAARRRVRQGTVRAQLKQIFAKTGCRTQADLVRLVLIGPAVLRRSA